MAGSPKKRARKKARELALAQGTGSLPQPETAAPAGSEAPARCADGDIVLASPPLGLPAPIEPEILPPAPKEDPTKTALRRAMRRKAEEHAERAIAVLAEAMDSEDERVRVAAAEKILDRAYGKPTPEIEVGEGGLQVVILKFGGDTQ